MFLPRSHVLSGLVGCMREIRVNDQRIEPRYVINTERVIGEVALDNCQFVDPCKRPNTCEHGGKCSVKEDRITCDCTDTGYIGKNCHFGEMKCERRTRLTTTLLLLHERKMEITKNTYSTDIYIYWGK